MIQVVLVQLAADRCGKPAGGVLGEISHLPEEGKPFRMLSSSNQEGEEVRLVYTTPVRKMERKDPPDPELDTFFEFWTEQSHYYLHILDMDVMGSA